MVETNPPAEDDAPTRFEIAFAIAYLSSLATFCVCLIAHWGLNLCGLAIPLHV